MRQIEFRGLRTDGRGWAYGYYLEEKNSIVNPHVIYTNGIFLPVAPETVGQFTGLHHKDGNKIWEGDVDQSFSVVIFNKKLCLFALHYWSLFLQEWVVATYPFDSSSIQIIGNIHEHPELIK